LLSTYEAVIRNQTKGLLLRFAVVGTKWGWKSTRGQAVYVGLFLSLLITFDNGNLSDYLFEGDSVGLTIFKSGFF